MLKDTNDQCDEGLKTHLYNYARTLEDTLTLESEVLCSVQSNAEDQESCGLAQTIEVINNHQDFQEFMLDYLGKIQSTPSESPMQFQPFEKPYFGHDLVELMERDNDPIPLVVKKCIDFVDEKGMKLQELYREPGNMKNIMILRDLFNRGFFRVIDKRC